MMEIFLDKVAILLCTRLQKATSTKNTRVTKVERKWARECDKKVERKWRVAKVYYDWKVRLFSYTIMVKSIKFDESDAIPEW